MKVIFLLALPDTDSCCLLPLSTFAFSSYIRIGYTHPSLHGIQIRRLPVCLLLLFTPKAFFLFSHPSHQASTQKLRGKIMKIWDEKRRKNEKRRRSEIIKIIKEKFNASPSHVREKVKPAGWQEEAER